MALGGVLVFLGKHVAVSRSNVVLYSTGNLLDVKFVKFITPLLIPTWTPEFRSPNFIDSILKICIVNRVVDESR